MMQNKSEQSIEPINITFYIIEICNSNSHQKINDPVYLENKGNISMLKSYCDYYFSIDVACVEKVKFNKVNDLYISNIRIENKNENFIMFTTDKYGYIQNTNNNIFDFIKQNLPTDKGQAHNLLVSLVKNSSFWKLGLNDGYTIIYPSINCNYLYPSNGLEKNGKIEGEIFNCKINILGNEISVMTGILLLVLDKIRYLVRKSKRIKSNSNNFNITNEGILELFGQIFRERMKYTSKEHPIEEAMERLVCAIYYPKDDIEIEQEIIVH